MNTQRILIIVLSTFAALAMSGPIEGKEGFGASKFSVQLTRVRPPDVYIAGKRIVVRSSDQGQGGTNERQLIASLESELLGNDPRLKLDNVRPQTAVELAVLQNEISEHWESRTEKQTYKSGTDSKGKPRYSTRNVTVRYKVVSHVFVVAFKALDLRTGVPLAADNVTRNFETDYREGADAPGRAQLELSATTYVVGDVARRLTPTSEAIGVLVPKGTLKDLGNLAKAGLWNRYLESLESMPERAKPQDESYRQYALGVAYEALGYAAEEPEIALSYLEQASMHYNSAIDANPKEKYFTKGFKGSGFLAEMKRSWVGGDGSRKEAMAPVERVRSALEQYQRVVDFKMSDQKQLASLAGGAKTLGEGNAESEAITNASIIEMSQAGLPEDIILTTVETAPSIDFDVSPKGLVELAQGKVSTKIIQRIQAVATSKND